MAFPPLCHILQGMPCMPPTLPAWHHWLQVAFRGGKGWFPLKKAAFPSLLSLLPRYTTVTSSLPPPRACLGIHCSWHLFCYLLPASPSRPAPWPLPERGGWGGQAALPEQSADALFAKQNLSDTNRHMHVPRISAPTPTASPSVQGAWRGDRSNPLYRKK